MGKSSWENILANPGTGDKTVVADSTTLACPLEGTSPHAGDKKSAGNPIERAGLTGGDPVRHQGHRLPASDVTGIPSVPVHRAKFEDVPLKSGAQLEDDSVAAGDALPTSEDGTWDPAPARPLLQHRELRRNSRLWRLRFDDPANPAAGGVWTCCCPAMRMAAPAYDTTCSTT
jgi:hypothetical protein